MSFTLPQKPPTFAPGYNFMIYVTASGKASQPNYRATVDIKIGGNTIATIKQFPLADGYTVFDIHRIVENYLSYDIAPQSSPGFIGNVNSYVQYQTVWGEEYGSIGSSGYVTSTGLITSSGYAYNAAFDFLPFQSYNQADWLITTGSQKKFLTNGPLVRGIRFGTSDWLHFMSATSSLVDHGRLITYNSAGGVIASNALIGGGAQFARLSSGPG